MLYHLLFFSSLRNKLYQRFAKILRHSWNFVSGNSRMANLIKSLLSKRFWWCQENNGSSFTLSVSYKAAVATLICPYSKFTSWSSPSLLLKRESIIHIAPWLIDTVFSLPFLDLRSKFRFMYSRVELWELCIVMVCSNLSGICTRWAVTVLFLWELGNVLVIAVIGTDSFNPFLRIEFVSKN